MAGQGARLQPCSHLAGVCRSPPSRHRFWLSPAPATAATTPFVGFGERDTHRARPRLGQDYQGWSKAPEATGWVRPLPKARASTHMPSPTQPGVGGNPPPPSPRPLLALGQVTRRLLTLPAPSRALPGCTSATPGSSPCSTRAGRGRAAAAPKVAHTARTSPSTAPSRSPAFPPDF